MVTITTNKCEAWTDNIQECLPRGKDDLDLLPGERRNDAHSRLHHKDGLEHGLGVLEHRLALAVQLEDAVERDGEEVADEHSRLRGGTEVQRASV